MRKAKGQESRVESQKRVVALRLNSGPRPSSLDPRPARGFTLVELLITIMIIGVLAALILGVASIAAENAREQHTRHVVARLHTLLTEHYETYKNRRIKVQDGVIARIEQEASSNNWSAAQKGRAIAEARMYALRELMLMEMPDRWSDVTLPTTSSPIGNPFYFGAPATAIQASGVTDTIKRTPLAAAYLRRVLRSPAPTAENQSAECLYMIITLACGDGEARSMFGENTIGDTDNDGAPEFIDGWKHPIRFLRWAPGFDSQLQANANQLDDPESGTSDQAWAAASSSDHDPFDMYRVDQPAFRLVPLIFSLGRDEEPDDESPWQHQTWPLVPNSMMTMQFSPQAPHITRPRLTPFVKNTTGYPDNYPGTKFSEEDTDNIHNHLMGLR